MKKKKKQWETNERQNLSFEWNHLSLFGFVAKNNEQSSANYWHGFAGCSSAHFGELLAASECALMSFPSVRVRDLYNNVVNCFWHALSSDPNFKTSEHVPAATPTPHPVKAPCCLSGKRYRSICCCTDWLQSSFIPQAVRPLNASCALVWFF